MHFNVRKMLFKELVVFKSQVFHYFILINRIIFKFEQNFGPIRLMPGNLNLVQEEIKGQKLWVVTSF